MSVTGPPMIATSAQRGDSRPAPEMAAVSVPMTVAIVVIQPMTGGQDDERAERGDDGHDRVAVLPTKAATALSVAPRRRASRRGPWRRLPSRHRIVGGLGQRVDEVLQDRQVTGCRS
jgi:hypothetical protein